MAVPLADVPNPAFTMAGKYPAGVPVTALDADDWGAMMEAAYRWLELNHGAVNALIVFPVPDGDTGTNMLLTMRDACQEMKTVRDPSVGALLQALAHGALMGARGNSGVILSQILRGMARAVDRSPTLTTAAFATALQEGSTTAYRGVQRPVEGTILTVVREAADASRRAAALASDFRFVLDHTVQAAGEAVEKTPSLLKVLAEAGVVDAGGKGLYYILEGWLRCLRGETITESDMKTTSFAGHAEALAGGYGYDVQYIIQGERLDVEAIRDTISRMGDSVIVVGDERAVKVHVHTNEPGMPLNYGASVGRLSQIIVENMQEQFREFVHGSGSGEGPAAASRQVPTPSARAVSPISVVAVVPGRGLQQVLLSLGISAIVPGGQTMNPSTEEVLKAIEGAPSDQVIVLPNNSNVILTARQAQQLSHKDVRVVPSKTIPQGIAAFLAFSLQADLDANARDMEAALADIQTGEVTVAVRAARFNGIQVAPGDVIGLLNDQLTTKGSRATDVAMTLLEQMRAQETEIITIYRGEPESQEAAEALAEAVRARYPAQDVELVSGEQPYYHYIISAE
ncbi:MAG: DAK2 domain-containing protein [Anaerolineae bacterium]|nr:DAK2 domain-containing protein [Anaerolineae bacterium]